MENVIHYLMILDKSGSMAAIRKEVISTFNEQVDQIQKLKRKNPEFDIRITLCTFNDDLEFPFVNENVDAITRMKKSDYQPDSCTALYDAIGVSFLRLNELVKLGEQVIVGIITDGLENASKTYTGSDVRVKIQQAREKSWDIQFFCRAEDNEMYLHSLNLNRDDMSSISMDQKGLLSMNSQMMYCMDSAISEKKK